MQSKGAIRLVAILLALACVWQLSFTAVTGREYLTAVGLGALVIPIVEIVKAIQRSRAKN